MIGSGADLEVMAKRAVPDFAWNQTYVVQLMQPAVCRKWRVVGAECSWRRTYKT